MRRDQSLESFAVTVTQELNDLEVFAARLLGAQMRTPGATWRRWGTAANFFNELDHYPVGAHVIDPAMKLEIRDVALLHRAFVYQAAEALRDDVQSLQTLLGDLHLIDGCTFECDANFAGIRHLGQVRRVDVITPIGDVFDHIFEDQLVQRTTDVQSSTAVAVFEIDLLEPAAGRKNTGINVV